MQFIDFAPGVAELDGAADANIKSVAKALLERPQLKIEVPIAIVPVLDREAIGNERFQSEVVAAMRSSKLVKSAAPGAGPPELAALDMPVQVKILAALYQQKVGMPAKYPEISKDEPEDSALRIKREYLEKALREGIVVSDAELRGLAQQRAEAIQKGLLADGQIDPTRLFLVVNDKGKAQGAEVRLELSLQ